MTDFERGIIDLVKAGVTGKSVSLAQNFDWEQTLKMALKHQIVPMLYYGVKNSRLTVPADILSELELAAFSSVAVSSKQMYTLEEVFESFEKNGIEYMPLKGSVLKSFYPKPEMRQMGDADILIKPQQYDEIKPIMLELGFEEKIESDHELNWIKKGVLFLELHKRLIPSYNKDYYAYFGDGWRLAQKTETSRFDMSDEDNLIYMFTHYAKHYRDGGIGIRHLVDFYVFLNAKKDMDEAYVEKELGELQLLEFYKNSMRTLSVWFGEAEGDEITDFMTSKIIGSGSYGTTDAHIISSAVKTSKTSKTEKGIKVKKIFDMVFVPYKNMKQLYPSLKKFPFLLPIMWIIRLVNTIFNRQDRIKKHSEELKLMTTENIIKYQDELDFVGLDFNFKE